MSTITESMSSVRDFINKPRRQYALIKNLKSWNQLCASMDAIEYSNHAVDAYIAGDSPEDHGERYLRLFGLMQALVIQQDAIKHLYEALSYEDPLRSVEKLKEIRNIRHDCAGHPTKQWSGTAHFTFEVEKTKFKIISYKASERHVFREIETLELAQEQQRIISEVLDRLIDIFQVEEQRHKDKFKMIKLADYLDVGYPIEKIMSAIERPEHLGLGPIHLDELSRKMGDFEKALAERGINTDTYDSIHYLFEDLRYIVAEFGGYFESLKSGQEPRLSKKDAELFGYSLDKKVEELVELAQELDDEYSVN